MTSKSDVGMIGTGLMGTAMTRRLVAGGFTVHGYDPNADALAIFKAAGGKPCTSLADLAAKAGRAVISVFNSDQVEDVVATITAIAPTERALKLVINTSTVEPDRMVALAPKAAAKGLQFMELPLSGSVDQISTGTVLGLVGDNGGNLENAKDMLAAFCPRYVEVGPVGNGAKSKLAINLIVGLNRAALAEGLVFAERLGLPLDAFLAAAKQSAAYSKLMEIKGPKMVAGDFEPHGRIRQSRKDFSLINGEAKARGQPLPLGSVYLELMEGAIAAGDGEIDNAGVIREIRRRGR